MEEVLQPGSDIPYAIGSDAIRDLWPLIFLDRDGESATGIGMSVTDIS